MVSGTMEATVPTAVPTISLVSGNTTIIRIRKGTERKRLITTPSVFISQLGSGRTPPFSPATRRTPRGSPRTMARAVATTVT